MRKHELDWRVTLRQRVIVAAGIVALWVGGIEARLVYLQVFERGELEARAERQHQRTLPLPAVRGDLLDRRGRVLATSVDADSIIAVPSEIDDANDVVAQLCRVFEDCTAEERIALVKRLGRSNYFAYVRRQVSPEIAKRVAELNLRGIGSRKESRRYYPNSELAAHVLGFVGVDNKGLGGIEAAYDANIRGQDGTVLVHIDAWSRAFSNRVERAPTAGQFVELTIDEYLQHVAERELERGIRETRASGGSVVILEPSTGEILAMANLPTFNPNVYRRSSPEARRNRAVQDLYEPGSAFKVVTAAAAVEEGLMPLDAPIDVHGGSIRIGKSRIVRDDHTYGTLSFSDVIIKSSNVGAIKIAFMLGSERFSPYVTKFGFGQQVSPDFPGENPGLPPSKWSESALASVAFGHEIAVTPLQMVTAVNSVANSGLLMQPHVARALYRNGERVPIPPKVVRRVVSPATAASVTGILEGVVERGTATSARIPGYLIAGKTGTARKIVDGRYSRRDYNASFVGYFPSRKPVATVIVVIDSPRASIYGGSVAAPIFRRIADATLRYLGVAPTTGQAPFVLADTSRSVRPAAPSAERLAPSEVHLIEGDAVGVMPDVIGLSARDAMRALVAAGLTPHLTGDGFVVAQDPSPGEAVGDGHLGRLVLARRIAPAGGE